MQEIIAIDSLDGEEMQRIYYVASTTISQAVRTCEVRRSRYRGLSKTHLQLILTATALNVHRMGMWLAEEPLAQTRHARFARLYYAAA